MKYIQHLLIPLLALLFFSCDEREDVASGRGISFYPLQESVTRANEVENFADGDAIGVYVLDKSAGSVLKSSGNFADNKKFVWNNEKRAFIAANSDNLIFNSHDGSLEFYVYFPYKSGVVDATNLSHTIDGVGKKDDFLFAVNGETGGAQNIPLTFKHLLSKVNVKYTSSENREYAQMSVYTYTDIKINLATGKAATITNARTDISLEKVLAADHAAFVGVVAPQSWKQGEKFATLSYTGGGSYPFSFAQERTFVSGEVNEVTFMPKQPAYVFYVTPSSLPVSALDPSQHSISVTSQKNEAINGATLPNTTVDIGYSLTANPDWITVSGSSISVSENRGSSRSGTVTFTQAESGYQTSIDVQQAAAVVTTDYTFNFAGGGTSTSWNGVDASGGSQSYSITSNKQTYINGTLDRTDNISYSGSSSVGWITVSGSTINVSENRSSSRSGTVTFTQAESGKTVVVSVQQSGGSTTYDYTFTFNGGGTSTSWNGVDAVGGTNSYSITSTRQTYINGTLDRTDNMNYSGSSNVGWITVSGTSVIVSANYASARSGTVTFTQAESGRTVTVSVQQAAAVVTTDYTFNFAGGGTSTSWNGVDASGGSQSYSITSNKQTYINGTLDRTDNISYSGSSSVGWITVSGSTINVSENRSSSRSGTVTFTQAESGKTVVVSVQQSGGSTTYDYTFTFNGGGTSTSWNGVDAVGGTNSYSITSHKLTYINGTLERTDNISYSGSSNVDWITVSGSSINVSENRSSSRSGTVTFTQAESGKTVTVSVQQSEGSITHNYTFTFDDGTTSTSWTSISASGDSKSLSVTSNRLVYINGTYERTETIKYSGTGNVGWASVSGTTITVDDNPNTSPRGGVITFTQVGSRKTITVTLLQLKKNSVDIN